MNRRKCILLADDNPKDIELALAALQESQGFQEVVVGRDGVEVLDFLFRRGTYANRAPGNPELILLDLKMPKVNGFEVLKTIKSDPQLKLIPVVMLTSSREERDVRESYAHGANAYIVKPVSFQIFVQILKNTGSFWGMVNEPPPSQE